MKINNRLIRLNAEVSEAIKKNLPILAMESTIISHGLPYPENIEIAKELENISRLMGVTPATICIYKGKIQIGIDKDILQDIATSKDVAKVTRRNLPEIIASGKSGATTVAATMIGAAAAGIKVFATGGIGGVHRNGEISFDISADLREFTKTPVIVVSAGAKAILDLPKTLECMETLGVPVYGFRTCEFPAFYSRHSGLKIKNIDTVEEISEIFRISEKMGFSSGMLVANPIPCEDEIPMEIIAQHISMAINEAESKKIIGPALTPYLLKRIVELTDGRSLQANLQLVRNNVRLGCELAKVLYNEL